MKSEAQILLAKHLRELKLGEVVYEHKWHEFRKWRFDLAIPSQRLAFEIEGGAFVRGRHTRGKGFIADMEKYNTAQMQGWRVLRFTPQQVLKGEALDWLQEEI